MQRKFQVVIELDAEVFYLASVPELYRCRTQAQTIEEVLAWIKKPSSSALMWKTPTADN